MNTNISSFNLPDNIVEIGSQCFKECVSLSFFNITDSSQLRIISYGVFDGCVKFSKLSEFSSANFFSDSGAMYNRGKTSMIVYPPASPSSVFALAYTVESIAESAFIGCVYLKSIMIPDGILTTIGNNAFEGCINLRHINIPRSVKQIGSNAFIGCRSLVCGSVIVDDKTIRPKLIASGIKEKSLDECIPITCHVLMHDYKYLPVYVFILL